MVKSGLVQNKKTVPRKVSMTLEKLDSREILGQTVSIFGTIDEPLFLAKDVADWIGHRDVWTMIKNIDDDEKIKIESNTLDSNFKLESGNLRTSRWFLTENGLYEVLFQSRKPLAKAFKREVKKILKTIRETGNFSYSRYGEFQKEIEKQLSKFR
jgi:prophage antirepressor-like protein